MFLQCWCLALSSLGRGENWTLSFELGYCFSFFFCLSGVLPSRAQEGSRSPVLLARVRPASAGAASRFFTPSHHITSRHVTSPPPALSFSSIDLCTIVRMLSFDYTTGKATAVSTTTAGGVARAYAFVPRAR